MQPLISPVDHHSSHREEGHAEASESTPLLSRFPETSIRVARSPYTAAVVSLLLLVLVAGIIIGIYLLIIQNEAENILPPADDMSLRLVSRSQWNPDAARLLTQSRSAPKAMHVIAVQTDTRECGIKEDCILLLREMEANSSKPVPYNFLISSSGQTFEGLGWRGESPLFPEHAAPKLVLAFIGDFTEKPPTRAQMVEAKNFCAASVSLQHLTPTYSIITKNNNRNPKRLFTEIHKMLPVNRALSDS